MGYPSLPVDEYRAKLKETVAFPIFRSVDDDPLTPADERRTYCSHFVRCVVRWFNFTEWEHSHKGDSLLNPVGQRASDIRNWMSSHPARWRALTIPTGHADFKAARDEAVAGHLVVAAQVAVPQPGAKGWQASGHVCIVAPEVTMHPSGTFKVSVPLVANVGGKDNAYGIPLSKAFRPDPEVGLWVLIA